MVEITGTLVNTGFTLTPAADTTFGNLQIGGLVNGIRTPGAIQGGTVLDEGGGVTLVDATLDGGPGKGRSSLEMAIHWRSSTA